MEKKEKLNILYNIADIFVFPSREEPLGLVGLEAIVSGTPVIGSNVGGIKEYINNKMLLYYLKSNRIQYINTHCKGHF